MKKPFSMVLLVLILTISSALAEARVNYSIARLSTAINNLKIFDIIIIEPELEVKMKLPKIRNHNSFLYDMGFRESSNNYKSVNQFGYLGKYQFGRQTLNAIGFENISNREFLSNPYIQEEAMLILLKKNKRTLRRQIEKYDGQVVHNILVTESGILAAAHLGGAGNVKKWFRNGKVFRDGNGTSITSYMIKFSNYNLNL